MPDFRFLEFSDTFEQREDVSAVLEDYLKHMVNKKLRLYKQYLHTEGVKQGQSLYSHVMDLVSFVDRLVPVLGLSDEELRCVYLALTVHDINKIPRYGQGPGGQALKYGDAASLENIRSELGRLEVEAFFPAWTDFLPDIVFLAHAHQVSLTGTLLLFNQAYMDQTRLKSRLKGPLKYLVQAADVSDNSHSGDQRDRQEVGLRDRLITHINGALGRAGQPFAYRFIGHRLAELRGIFTNVVHNALVSYFRETYGEQACIDVQYYPEGVNYLLAKDRLLSWNDHALHEVARRIGHQLATMQLRQLAQFIRPKPSAIVVDDAALRSGASLAQIFEMITLTVMGKHYSVEWRTQRNALLRSDGETALAAPQSNEAFTVRLSRLLEAPHLLPSDDAVLRRGEFIAAYRKFLEDHRSGELKALREDAWMRAYRLFALPEERYPLYRCMHPYRRGYFLAGDVPDMSLDEMKQRFLIDLAELSLQAAQVQTKTLPERVATESVALGDEEEDFSFLFGGAAQQEVSEQEEEAPTPFGQEYLVDYLQRHLEVWDSAAPQSLPIISFQESLHRYANAKRQHAHCCHCGTPLEADEWMAMQVPPSIGVQSFSNRLEGGSAHEPKRNICAVCRTQFILEKLAWRGHRDKQSAEQVTFYLHLFPYAFFTRPLLRAWWYSIEKLRDADHTAFFLDTRNYFRLMQHFQTEVRIRGFGTRANGLNLPALSETMSTTPILPLVAPGNTYGLQFLLALEKAVVLVRWFECRAILSRSPVPPLNLAHGRVDGQPIVLMVEGIPRTMNWLVSHNSLTRGAFEILVKKLTLLHQLSEKLFYVDPAGRGKTDAIPHDFAVAAADDSLALYYVADRSIEKKVAAEKGRREGAPELQAISLSRAIAPILDELLTL